MLKAERINLIIWLAALALLALGWFEHSMVLLIAALLLGGAAILRR
jgi:hypothetical protein